MEDIMEELESFQCEIDGSITDIKSDFYGKKLAIGTTTGKIILYENFQGKLQKKSEIKAHNGIVFKVEFTNPKFGPYIISCGYDKKVNIIQEGMNGQLDLIYEFNEFPNSVTCLSISYDINQLIFISGCLDGNITIHKFNNNDFENETIFAHDFGVNSISFFKNSKNNEFVTCGNDNLIKIWKFNNDSKKFENYDTIKEIECISNDVCCRDSQHFASCSEDGSVYYWKKDEGKWNPKEIISNPTPVIKVAFNEEGSALAIIGTDGVHQVYSEKSF